MTDLVIDNDEARVNLTWAGQNSDLADPIHIDSTDGDIKAWLTEAVRNGDMPGMAADPDIDLTDFVIDRFGPTEDRPWALVSVRPKTPFGGQN